MKFQRRLREQPAINITPLIDVVFLLLIFFMVTTTFSRETRLSVELPEAGAASPEQQRSQLEILVARQGVYYLNGRGLADTTAETLMLALEAEAGGDRSRPVLLTADARTSHQAVVTAMDAIARAGFSRLRIATREPLEAAAPGANDDQAR